MWKFTSSRLSSIAALMALLLAVSFTPSLAAAEPGAGTDAAATSAGGMETGLYLVGPEDVLEISVWKNPDLSKIVTVRPDGMISLPLIGDIMAAGRTPAEIHNVIVERLKAYQSSVVVSVIVNQVNSYRVFVVGEVKSPGTYSLKTRTSVLQAVAMAGGFTQFAAKNKMLLVRDRSSGARMVEKIRISFDEILRADMVSDNNIILMPGDTIIVP